MKQALFLILKAHMAVHKISVIFFFKSCSFLLMSTYTRTNGHSQKDKASD